MWLVVNYVRCFEVFKVEFNLGNELPHLIGKLGSIEIS